MKIVFIGLTVSSSWGNGHATTYRGLIKELCYLKHEVTFLEHDKPWYKNNRDLSTSSDFNLYFYPSVDNLKQHYAKVVQEADLVIVGSYVPEGVNVIRWVFQEVKGVVAFYDIDTPVTLEKLDGGDFEYLSKELIPNFDLYLSFSGGEVLTLLEEKYKAKKAKALFCSVDPSLYFPMNIEKEWKMGYLGTYSLDRQEKLNQLLIDPALLLENHRFVVAGSGYPEDILWPKNVERILHLSPEYHCKFYNQQEFTLNVTRSAMVNLGYSPSVRLFEAAACGAPIISDDWKGLTDILEENKEILIARSTLEMKSLLEEIGEEERFEIGRAARTRILENHTAAHRAKELLDYYHEVIQIPI
jgi:spore maturation protein CgeB